MCLFNIRDILLPKEVRISCCIDTLLLLLLLLLLWKIAPGFLLF
jgi:hypothetical protein